MKYLHVSPPWYVFHGEGSLRQPMVPLGAAYCARAALSAGWDALIWNGDLLPEGVENQYSQEMSAYSHYLETKDVAMLDAGVWEDYHDLLRDYQPDVIGITSLTASHPSALVCAKIAKELLPNVITVFGGPHPSALPMYVVQERYVDFVIPEEGEIALQNLLTDIYHQKPKTYPGIYRADFVQHLDELHWPAKGKVVDRYGLLQRDHYGLVMYSRGCPFRCEFCASPELWTRSARWKSAEDLADEMVAVHKQYDTRYFSMQDDTFTLNRKRTMQLCHEIIERGLPTVPGFRWTCNTRPELVDAELLETMQQAGCAAVAIGIEFGSPRMLKKVQKGFTVEQVRDGAKIIKQSGLISSGQFMVGYPTETAEEMWQTARLAEELEMDSVMLSVATPLPNTPLYHEAHQLGLIGPPTSVDWGKVTTKNDGMLMTAPDGKGGYKRMPKDERVKLIKDLQESFDAIQQRTLDRKNQARLEHEKKYILEATPVYGIQK